MANCAPTCSEYNIEVPTPKDADNRRVPLDTKVMYNSEGIEYTVSSLIFDTGKFVARWDVKCFTSPSDVMYTYPLDSMYLEKPDSLKMLAEDLNRIQAKHEANGSTYREATCYYAGRLASYGSCKECRLNCKDKTCFEAMMEDIVNRVNRLAGDSE